MYTALIGSILVLFSIQISIFAIKQRRRTQTAYGSGEDKLLTAAVTAHSNFISYTPLFLILLYLLESNSHISHYTILILGVVFIVARVLHFYGVCYKEQEEKPVFQFRIAGMLLTFTSLGITALINIYFSFTQILNNL